jgi:hypothetical protein
MPEHDPDNIENAEDVVSSAREIVDQLRSKWQEKGFPSEVLALAMIEAGITYLSKERGAEAAQTVLQGFLEDIEQTARGRST